MAKIGIFGCRKITIDVIDYIRQNSEHEIVFVATKDYERDRIYHNELVSEKCNKLGIRNFEFIDEGANKLINELNPDILFSLYYRNILKSSTLQIPKLGCINIHPGFLPKDRGPAPSLWNILNGDTHAGTTIHYMVEPVDAGDIIDQKQIEIGNMTGFELNTSLMDLGFDLFRDNFNKIITQTNDRIPQNQELATYTLHFSNNLRYIEWKQPNNILNQIRAFAKPFDGALAYNKYVKLVVFAASPIPERTSFSAPGFYELMDNGEILVQTCTQPVLISKYNIVRGALHNKGRFSSGPPLAKE